MKLGWTTRLLSLILVVDGMVRSEARLNVGIIILISWNLWLNLLKLICCRLKEIWIKASIADFAFSVIAVFLVIKERSRMLRLILVGIINWIREITARTRLSDFRGMIRNVMLAILQVWKLRLHMLTNCTYSMEFVWPFVLRVWSLTWLTFFEHDLYDSHWCNNLANEEHPEILVCILQSLSEEIESD